MNWAGYSSLLFLNVTSCHRWIITTVSFSGCLMLWMHQNTLPLDSTFQKTRQTSMTQHLRPTQTHWLLTWYILLRSMIVRVLLEHLQGSILNYCSQIMLFPFKTNILYLSDFSTSTDDGILALVRSRCNYPLTQASQKPPDHSFEFQLLQKDLIKAVLVGRPCLHLPAEHLRKAFKFHKPVAQGLALGVSLADVETLNQYLTDDSGLKVTNGLVYNWLHFTKKIVTTSCCFSTASTGPNFCQEVGMWVSHSWLPYYACSGHWPEDSNRTSCQGDLTSQEQCTEQFHYGDHYR